MKKFKRTYIFALLAVALLAIVLSKFMFKTEVDLSGYLAFDKYADNGMFVYNFSTEELERLKTDELVTLSNVTGYNPENNSYYCVGRRTTDGYFVMKVSSGRITDSWHLPKEPMQIKAIGNTVIIIMGDSVLSLNTSDGNMSTLLENAEFNKIVTYENKFVLWSEGFHYTGELEKDTVKVDGPIQHISSLKVCGFVEQNTLLTYKFNMGDTACYFYDLQTNKISKTDYDIDQTFPVVISGDNILCMYESNYTDEIKWYNYQVSKNKLTRIKNDNVMLAARYVEWIS